MMEKGESERSRENAADNLRQRECKEKHLVAGDFRYFMSFKFVLNLEAEFRIENKNKSLQKIWLKKKQIKNELQKYSKNSSKFFLFFNYEKCSQKMKETCRQSHISLRCNEKPSAFDRFCCAQKSSQKSFREWNSPKIEAIHSFLVFQPKQNFMWKNFMMKILLLTFVPTGSFFLNVSKNKKVKL